MVAKPPEAWPAADRQRAVRGGRLAGWPPVDASRPRLALGARREDEEGQRGRHGASDRGSHEEHHPVSRRLAPRGYGLDRSRRRERCTHCEFRYGASRIQTRGSDDFQVTESLRHENQASSPYGDLLDRARRRDTVAFTRLYEATHNRVFSYLLARLGARATAEDLLQEVYVSALRGLGRFRGSTEGEFMAWLFKVAHGEVVDHLRSQYRHPEVNRSDLQPNDTVNPLDTIDERLGLGEIALALAKLTEAQRDVVLNRFVLGFDLKETSHLMHKNVGSIKALQHRALARLARTLRAPGGEHD